MASIMLCYANSIYLYFWSPQVTNPQPFYIYTNISKKKIKMKKKWEAKNRPIFIYSGKQKVFNPFLHIKISSKVLCGALYTFYKNQMCIKIKKKYMQIKGWEQEGGWYFYIFFLVIEWVLGFYWKLVYVVNIL